MVTRRFRAAIVRQDAATSCIDKRPVRELLNAKGDDGLAQVAVPGRGSQRGLLLIESQAKDALIQCLRVRRRETRNADKLFNRMAQQRRYINQWLEGVGQCDDMKAGLELEIEFARSWDRLVRNGEYDTAVFRGADYILLTLASKKLMRGAESI